MGKFISETTRKPIFLAECNRNMDHSATKICFLALIVILSMTQLALSNIPGVPSLNNDELYTIGTYLLDVKTPADLTQANNVMNAASISLKVNECKTKAEEETIRLFGEDQDNTEGNAFKHAYWSALMVKYINYENAEKFGTAHETGNEGNTNIQMDMDLHNNQVGLNIGNGFSSQSDEIISLKVLNSVKSGNTWKIENNKLVTTKESGSSPSQTTAAVDMLSVGTPQSNVVWQETSPTDSSGSNIQGTTQTTSQSTDAKFSFGDRVEVTTSLGLHVRSVPGDLTNDPVIPLEPKGSLGTIQEGSRVYKNGFYWVEIKYDDGKTGWSAENWLESVQSNQQPVTQSTETGFADNQLSVTQPVDPQPVTQSTETAFGDNQLSVTQPVDPQPVTSPYASQIPVGDTQTTHYFSSVDQPPGKVTVGLDIRDENGNIVPVGTTVMVKDGSGEYVQVDWDSTGHALAYGAPGNWIVTVDAPGYETNTQYTPVSSSSSSTSFRMNLQRAGFNDQPAPISSPSVTQPVDQTVSSVAKVPLELDIRNENGNIVPTGTVVTVKDGNNNVVQVNWDSTGHALAYGAPGNWIVTVDAPGYETNTQYTPVSSSSSSTSFRMNLLKDGINIQPPVSSPPVSSPPVDQQLVTQPVNQQTYSQPINQQPATQPSEPTLGENEHGPTFGEVDQQPVESQPYSQPINQQPATQPSEPTLGENEHGPTFGEVDQQPVESQPYSQPIGYGNVSPG
jgi:hypothetical protein